MRPGILAVVTYRGILLDFYGTVVEEDDPVIEGIVRKIASECPDCSEHELGRLWGKEFVAQVSSSYGDLFRTQRELVVDSLAAILEQAGSALDPGELAADQFTYWNQPTPRPGAAEFISSCPVPVCIVSNIDTADLLAAIRYTGLPLPMTVTSEEVRSYKPRAELFMTALGRLGLGPDEVLHIGDSLGSDIAGANALGIDAVWVNATGRIAPRDTRVLCQVSDLREILPVLELA